MAVWIRTPEALHELARSFEGCRAIGLDTESDSLYHHFDKVCLVQISTDRGERHLVDSLVLRDLSALAPAISDPGLVKVLHGADYDVSTLKRDFGFGFASLFDTMIAARLLGRTELGLAATARDELGVTLSKAFQKDDWSRRPLTPQQESYALSDVTHLVELYQRLRDQLEALGRLDWAREEFEAVAALEPARKRRDPQAFLSIKGARQLAPRAMAVLRELHAWREQLAEQTDVPAFKLLGNESLLRIAAAPDAAEAAAHALPSRVKRYAGDLRAAIARAQALAPDQLPVLSRSPRPVLPNAVLQRVQRLKSWRTGKAAELKLDVSVVLPQRLIERLAEAGPRDTTGLAAVDGLRRWRIDAFGREILGIL